MGVRMQTTQGQPEELLKIGAVSRLTGVSTHTLRKWETRYGAISPRRTENGDRRYSRGDLERLLIIKRLVDAGESPRDVAGISDVELKQKLEQLSELQRQIVHDDTCRPRIVVVGSAVATLFTRRNEPDDRLVVVAVADGPASLATSSELGRIDVIVCDTPVVRGETRHMAQALRSRVQAAAVVIVYGFSARGDLSSLQAPWLATLRAPTDIRSLERVVIQLMDSDKTTPESVSLLSSKKNATDQVPVPRLSREVITRFARTPSKVQCECPHHLTDIVLSLRAFEEYSESCENLNAEDAELHRYLWRSAAQARALFEDAIERVAEMEGRTLTEGGSD